MRLGSKKEMLDRLAIALSVFKDYVDIQNGAYLFDSNRLAEGLMEDVLSQIGDWGKLKNLNDEFPNHPAIDLIDETGSVGVQVTSAHTLEKVKSTIKKYLALKSPPKALYILMITGRQDSYSQEAIDALTGETPLKFEVDKHILDFRGLYNIASGKGVESIAKAVQRLEEELGQRAINLLSRFHVVGDRVLRLFDSHQIDIGLYADLLDVPTNVAREELTDSKTLQRHLSSRVLKRLASDFNVPEPWINGECNTLGERYGSSQWRSVGEVKGLIKSVLSRYPSARFNFVVPSEMGDPFAIFPISCSRSSSPIDANYPILVYFEAKRKRGNVYGHLGVQPWTIGHHRKAALFFATALRDLQLRGAARLSASWWQWPVKLINATTGDTLLAEALKSGARDSLNPADAIYFNQGGWVFEGQPDMQDEFNNEYLKEVRGYVDKLICQTEGDRFMDSILADWLAKANLPPPPSGCSRIYGMEACRVAKYCGVNVMHVDEQRVISERSPSVAADWPEEELYSDDEDRPTTVVYLDVCPASKSLSRT